MTLLADAELQSDLKQPDLKPVLAPPGPLPEGCQQRFGKGVYWVDGLAVDYFESLRHLFEGMVALTRNAKQTQRKTNLMAINVNISNLAHAQPRLKRILNTADMLYCDGAGIIWGSKLMGTPLPMRFTAADWLFEWIEAMSDAGLSMYFLAGEPGVISSAQALLDARVPGHKVVGMHHGYVLGDSALNQAVIDEINAKKPDILVVGMGCPLQEYWIDDHRHLLDVPVCFAIGATWDYLTGKVPRCPAWMGENGLEWLFRFIIEPKRMFNRYIMGNPGYIWRVFWQSLGKKRA
ncbi:MAG: WecB/TagA/CpsF family glycosyltransferase [Vampirovibrionales bacterium]|nr:WecB/TagA/CpsF family glycosyltransferase [Vampirovibrionales bacterium]